jgi:hypothetical protein
MNSKNKDSKNPWWWILIIALAILSFLSGLYVLFFYHPEKSIYDSSLIGGLFSLTGVMLFAVALFYQIKEYKLQIEELRKSVDAQTETYKILERQTVLMQEQSTNSVIFNVIDKFNSYKEREDIQKAIHSYIDKLRLEFTGKYESGKIPLLQVNKLSMKEFSEILLSDIRECFNDKKKYTINLKNYVQFAFNVFHLIEKFKKSPEIYNWFRPFFFNQFTNEELVILYLSNLVPFGMPNTEDIQWNRPEISNFLNVLNIKHCMGITGQDEDYLFKYFKENEFKELFKKGNDQ